MIKIQWRGTCFSLFLLISSLYERVSVRPLSFQYNSKSADEMRWKNILILIHEGRIFLPAWGSSSVIYLLPLKKRLPRRVSPGLGILGARETRSIMQLPTTVTSKYSETDISAATSAWMETLIGIRLLHIYKLLHIYYGIFEKLWINPIVGNPSWLNLNRDLKNKADSS